MERLELLSLISQGESETLEFKKSTSLMKEVIETLCAFANTQGGYLIIGVNDAGKILGQQITDDTLKNIANEVKLNTDPKLYPTLQKVTIENKAVVLLYIEESPLKPHLAYGKPYIRVGASNQRVDRDMYAYMLQQRYNGYGFDYLTLPVSSISEIDTDLVYRFAETANQARNMNINTMLLPEMILENLELSKNGVLTKAALLLFGKNPTRHFANHFELKCGLFADNTRFDKIINDKEFSVNLIDNFLFAYNFVIESLKTESNIINEKRVESPEFPYTVIREAIVNMIVHRDYRVDIKSTIEIRPDKITFYNPAHLFAPAISIDKLKQHHVSRTGNKLIAKIFYMMGYFENWGSGTLKIVNDTLDAAKPEPEFKFDNNIFELILFR